MFQNLRRIVELCTVSNELPPGSNMDYDEAENESDYDSGVEGPKEEGDGKQVPGNGMSSTGANEFIKEKQEFLDFMNQDPPPNAEEIVKFTRTMPVRLARELRDILSIVPDRVDGTAEEGDGKQVPGNDMSAVRESPYDESTWTTFDDLKREFPQIWDIDDAIVEGKTVEEPDLKLWKRAFMLTWTNDMKDPVESVKNDIREKLIETCEVESNVIDDWFTMDTDDYIELFNELYNKVSLDKLACVGL